MDKVQLNSINKKNGLEQLKNEKSSILPHKQTKHNENKTKGETSALF